MAVIARGLTSMKNMSVGRCWLGFEGLSAITDHLGRIKSLNVRYNDIGRGLATVAKGLPLLRNLEARTI